MRSTTRPTAWNTPCPTSSPTAWTTAWDILNSTPHGDPTPTARGTMARDPNLSLADLAGGERGTIQQMRDEEPAFLRFAGARGLIPGASVEGLGIGAYDGPIRVRAGSADTDLTPP